MLELGKRLKRGLIERTEGIHAEIGRLNADDSYTIRVEDTTNEVYVRLDGDPARVVTAINLKTAYQARLPVRLRRNQSGRYEVIDIDPLPVDAFLGEAAATANVPPLQGDTLKLILPGDKFKPGRVRSLNGTDLQIFIEEFPYGEIMLGGIIYDLTADVATLTADTKAHFVITVDTTNTADAIKGDEAGLALPLTRDDAFEVAVPAGQIALWSFILADTYTALPTKPLPADTIYEVDMRVMLRPGLTVKEVDGVPAVSNVHTIVVSNGSLTDNGDGEVALTTGGADPISTSYWRNRARLCSNTPMSVTSAPATIDSVTAVTGDRILVVGQGNPNKAQNGLWIYQGSGNPMTRPTDYAAGSTIDAFTGITVYIEAGTDLATAVFMLTTTGTITIDTTVTLWSDLNLVGTSRVQSISNKDITSSTIGDGITLNNNSTSLDVIVKGASDPNTLYVDTSADSVGIGTATPSAKLNVEGSVIINDTSADVDVRIESNGDPNNFVSDGGNDNIGIGTGTPDASTKLQVVSTTRGSVPAPVMTEAQRNAISSPIEGLLAYASDTDEPSFYDGQRWRAVDSVGWTPYAYPISFNPGAAFADGVSLAAVSGSIAIPMAVQSHMLLESVTVTNLNVALERTWGWNLYKQYLNNGNSGENTLNQVAAASANQTFTAAAVSIRTITAGSTPVYLAPGIYWLVVQCRHASNAFSIASTAVPARVAFNTAQTKTTGGTNGSTIDLVAATWVKVTDIIAARLNGRMFGETTQF